MHTKWLVGLFVSFLSVSAFSQTLFTYGKYSADAKDFLRMFNKNNTQPLPDRSKAIQDYLQLYINSRLKIQEAYERGYDSLPFLRTEIANLRSQIIENYLTDPTIADRLYREAFQRSQKDLHVAHIFISFNNPQGQVRADEAEKKKDEAVKRLASGEDFGKVAAALSDDPSAKTNKGDLGYITVFTLPYEFENIAYSTAVGKNSTPFQSKAGYHFFRVLGERKALGKIKAQQILLAIPPGADAAMKKRIGDRADSLYKKILGGADFGKLAVAFSNDVISAANNGTMPDFGTGRYDATFESMVAGLPKDGAVSKPFYTTHGWHIVKRLSIQPVISDPESRNIRQELEELIRADGRWKISRDIIAEKVIKKAGLKKITPADAALWSFADSLLDGTRRSTVSNITETTPLFRIGDTTIPVNAFINYARAFRYKTDGSGLKPYDQVMNDFVQLALTEYYRDHLEEFNDDFRIQMNEFRDGNLFFEIMQREVWNKAQTDSIALRDLYERKKSAYMWKQSADAVIFFCADQATGKSVHELVKKIPKDWRKIAETYNEKVVADSSRFEWGQIPMPEKTNPRAGMITTPLVNSTDNTSSFAYIINVYSQPAQRSFEEAKGLVINDYQVMVEEQWTAQLRKKYPVVVDQKVLDSILK